MQTPTESKLAPETQSLLDFLKAAKLKDSEGRSTVAGDAAAQAGITPPEPPMEPPMEPPAEAPPEQQGIAAVLDQAQQAAPSVAMNMQQPQGAPPQAMPPQDMAPPGMQPAGMPPQGMAPQGMPPQGMAEGGLASLPVHIPQFKEGGVIGFQAGGRSLAANPDLSEDDLLYLSKLSGRGVPFAPTPNALNAPEEESTSAIGDWLRGLHANIENYYKKEGAIGKLRQQRGAAELLPWESATPTEKASRAAQVAALTEQIKAMSSPDAAPQGSLGEPERASTSAIDFGKGDGSNKTSPAAAALAAKVLAAKQSATQQSATRAAARPAAGPYGGITAPVVEPLDLSEINKEITRLKEVQAKKPDLQGMGLADLAAQQQRDKESESFRRYASIYGSRTPGINAGASMLAAAGKFQALEDRAKSEADAAKTSLAKAEYADSIGDIEKVLKYREEAQKHMDNYRTNKAQLEASVYSQQMTSERAEESNALRSELAVARMASMVGAKTANLKDPSYVADKISDNVTKQMEALVKQPNISMKLKTPEDFERVRDSLMRKEIAAFKRGGADTSFIEGSLGQTLDGAKGKELDYSKIGK